MSATGTASKEPVMNKATQRNKMRLTSETSSVWLFAFALSWSVGLSGGTVLAQGEKTESSAQCPVTRGVHKHTTAGVRSYGDWWPNQLNLQILHQNSPMSSPMPIANPR